MSQCQFQDEEQSCSRRALPNGDFCAPHSRVARSVEELEETQALGEGTAAEIAEQLAFASIAAPEEKAAARPAKRPARVAAPVDPETLGSRIAEQLVARETAERLHRSKARARNAGRYEDGTTRPAEAEVGTPTFRVRPRRARADATRIVDSEGKSLVKPGWVPRWVRQVDLLNRPSESRCEEFKDFGYEVIIDPQTEKPITSHFGVAMQAPPEQYALRVKEYSPPGALNRADLYEDARLAIEEGNNEAGEEIARWVEEPSHKYSRKTHDLSVKTD